MRISVLSHRGLVLAMAAVVTVAIQVHWERGRQVRSLRVTTKALGQRVLLVVWSGVGFRGRI